MTLKEANTCRKYVVPKLKAAGWEDEPYAIDEQVTFTDGRILVVGRKPRRYEQRKLPEHWMTKK